MADIDKLVVQIEADASSAISGIDALAESLGKLKNATKGGLGISAVTKDLTKLSSVNSKAGNSYIDLAAKMKTAYGAIKKGTGLIRSAIKKSADYVENVNLFTVAMGEYAEAARTYAETAGEVLGIDPGEWMRNQGTFMTLATGFGVTGERANMMSKNLTQLGYDLSSFFNLPYEDAMQKLQSGLAGELEPLRRIGFDLSVARLQQEAYTLGIKKKVSSMTQAEKAELRYHAILTQVKTAQGDMARTLEQPANQLRIFKSQVEQAARSIGNIFIPLLKTVLPYLIAFMRVVRLVADSIASFFGYKEDIIDTSGIDSLASGADSASTALGGAANNAKKLKQYTMGFDELNVIDPNQGKDSDSGVGTGSGFDFELPKLEEITKEFETKADKIFEKMKEHLGLISGLVAGVGAGLLTWGFSKSFLTGLETFTAVLGAVLLIDSIRVTLKEGLSWKSAIEGAIGGALIGAAIGFKLGGWRGALGGVVIGIGVSLVINGITGMLADGVNVEDVVAIISGVLTTVGGVITVIKLFNSMHKNPAPDMETAGKTIEDTAKGTSKLTTKLKGLVKNLGLGIVIMAEVAIAAGIFVGAIWGIGKLLNETSKAWEPVIQNGDTVAMAIGIGTGLLVGVGLAAYLLGTITTDSGGTIAASIGIGMAMMLEIGAATALFLAEILVVGKLLEEIGIAWQPVLDNGDTVEKGIAIGTGLLVAIGVVTAALGMATVASAGLLPVAIGLGTALLLELGAAFVLFVAELSTVANQLSQNLAPQLDYLIGILPDLEKNMKQFTSFMALFAGAVVAFTLTSTIAGIAATIDRVVDFFTTDPVERLYDEVVEQTEDFENLIPALEKINPLITRATELVGEYKTNMGSFESATGGSGGFLNSIVKGAKGVINGLIGLFEGMVNGVIKCVNALINGLNQMSFEVPDWVPAIGGETFGFNIKKISEVTIPRLAEGGMPDTGQMFIAREAGPELVGSIGRRTAVVNNDQIVEGISHGVSAANTESNMLLREQNSLLRAMLEKETGVYLDGKTITKSVEKHQRERGRVLVTGGAY